MLRLSHLRSVRMIARTIAALVAGDDWPAIAVGPGDRAIDLVIGYPIAGLISPHRLAASGETIFRPRRNRPETKIG
jgi:hypothetical protein